MSEKLLTAKEVADLLQVSERTVMNLANRGELKGLKVAGMWRFSPTQIDAYLERQQQGSTPA